MCWSRWIWLAFRPVMLPSIRLIGNLLGARMLPRVLEVRQNVIGRYSNPLYRIFACAPGLFLQSLAQFMDHVLCRSACCRRVSHGSINWCKKGKENTARGIDNGTIATRVKTSYDISRRGALRSIARDQKD